MFFYYFWFIVFDVVEVLIVAAKLTRPLYFLLLIFELCWFQIKIE